MHFDGVDKIEKLALVSGFSIFELSDTQDQTLILSKAIHIAPQKDENSIKKEQIEKLSDLINSKQTSDLFVVFEQAELLTHGAANSFLKQLEEPGNKIHYVFLTTKMNLILQTIRSRAFCYVQNKTPFDPEKIDIKMRAKVKELIQAQPKDLKDIIDPYAKDTKTGRIKAIEFTRCASQLCLESYYKTGNKLFLEKAQKAAAACEAITESGNIRIQFIANML